MVPNGVAALPRQMCKERLDLVAIHEAHLWEGRPLRRNRRDTLADVEQIRDTTADVLEEDPQCCEPVIPAHDVIVARAGSPSARCALAARRLPPRGASKVRATPGSHHVLPRVVTKHRVGGTQWLVDLASPDSYRIS